MGVSLTSCAAEANESNVVGDIDLSVVGLSVVGATGNSVFVLVGAVDMAMAGADVIVVSLGSALGISLDCDDSFPSPSEEPSTTGRGGFSAIFFLGFVGSALGIELGSSLGEALGETLLLGDELCSEDGAVVGRNVGAAVVGDTDGMTLGAEVGESVDIKF